MSREDERKLLEAFEQAALHAYPNPERIGCPGSDFLAQLAKDRRSISIHDERLTHVTRCSPCFQEFATLRDEAVRHRQRRRLVPIAAGVLIVALGSVAYLEWNRFGGSSAAGAYVAATLDLKDRSTVRGVDDSTAQEPKPDSLKLPHGKLNLTVTLPVASAPGEYEIQVLREIGHPLLSASGTAAIQQGMTLLPVRLDLSSLHPGRYLLGVRRVPWDWTFLPLLVE